MNMIIIYTVMLAALLIISFIDIRERRISGKALLILVLGGAAAIMLNKNLGMLNGIAAMLIVFTLLGIISYVSKGSMGMGDAKLCAVSALYLGVEEAFGMLVLSMILCGITALLLIIVDKSYKSKSLPFAPFVTIGTIAMLILR